VDWPHAWQNSPCIGTPQLAQCKPSWLVNGFMDDSSAMQRAIFAHDAA
jgi:hypothetical protein